jgi:hypothetical protein
MHRMVLLGDEAQMEARFGPLGDSVSFSVIFLDTDLDTPGGTPW